MTEANEHTYHYMMVCIAIIWFITYNGFYLSIIIMLYHSIYIMVHHCDIIYNCKYIPLCGILYDIYHMYIPLQIIQYIIA